MKLKSVKINNYKCINKEIVFSTNDNLTCVVGKNETGKSSLLEALSSINSFFPNEAIFTEREFPLSGSYTKNKVLAISQFTVSSDDIKRIIELLGINILVSNNIVFYRCYDNITYVDANSFLSEKEYISQIKRVLKINNESIINFHTLANYLQSSNAIDESKYSYINRISNYVNDGYYTFVNSTLCELILPLFLYLSDDYLLKDNYSIRQIRSKKYDKHLTKSETLFLKLLENECEDIDLFLSNKDNVKTKKMNHLGHLSDLINSQLSKQEDIGRKIGINLKDQNAQINGNFDSEIHISVSDSSKSTIEYSLRSNGIKYFVSLMAWLSLIKDRNVILLLDEPGIGLHGSAQFELLDIIRNLNIQTIYTTHSPFMIDKYELNNIVTLEKNEKSEIIVSDRIIDRDHKSCMPLLAALGYSLNQGLFFSDYYIVVEGFSDLCYFNIMNKILEYPLDKKWQIIPAGSDTKISPLLKLLESNKLNAIVVCDKSPVGQVIESLKTEHNNTPMIQFNSIVEKKYADVEDLLDISNYIHIVKVINNIDDEIIENYEGISVKNICNIIKNKFPNANQDHDKIAKYIHEQGFDNIGFPEPKNIIENYTKLFNSINDTLANFDKQQKN